MSAEYLESPGARSIYSAYLSDEDIAALRHLLGFGVYQILSPYLRVDRRFLTAGSFSISLRSGSWVVVRSEWLGTPLEHFDYFRLTVKIEDAPGGIEITAEGGLVKPSEILLIPGADVIAMEILSVEYPEDGTRREQIKYDSAIRCFRQGGRHFCIAAQQSIEGQLEFTEDPAAMTKILEGCAIRLRIE